MVSVKLHKKFMKGLEERGINEDEFKGYKYAGGNKGCHLKYFKICGLIKEYPQPNNRCVCDHKIKENCYLVNDVNDILIIGNCCIKNFVPKENQGRHCSKCNNTHKNRKDNYCNDCRKLCMNSNCYNLKKDKWKNYCEDCAEAKLKADNWQRYCNNNKGVIRKCIDCGKSCGLYKRCFDCNQKFKKCESLK